MKKPTPLIIVLAAGTVVGLTRASVAQIADQGPAQLARQAIAIRTPYLAQMAQIL